MSAINYQIVSNHRDGLTEREIKKFFKKVKKLDIIQEYIDKTSFALTKSQKGREKRRKNAFFRRNSRKRR